MKKAIIALNEKTLVVVKYNEDEVNIEVGDLVRLTHMFTVRYSSERRLSARIGEVLSIAELENIFPSSIYNAYDNETSRFVTNLTKITKLESYKLKEELYELYKLEDKTEYYNKIIKLLKHSSYIQIVKLKVKANDIKLLPIGENVHINLSNFLIASNLDMNFFNRIFRVISSKFPTVRNVFRHDKLIPVNRYAPSNESINREGGITALALGCLYNKYFDYDYTNTCIFRQNKLNIDYPAISLKTISENIVFKNSRIVLPTSISPMGLMHVNVDGIKVIINEDSEINVSVTHKMDSLD